MSSSCSERSKETVVTRIPHKIKEKCQTSELYDVVVNVLIFTHSNFIQDGYIPNMLDFEDDSVNGNDNTCNCNDNTCNCNGNTCNSRFEYIASRVMFDVVIVGNGRETLGRFDFDFDIYILCLQDDRVDVIETDEFRLEAIHEFDSNDNTKILTVANITPQTLTNILQEEGKARTRYKPCLVKSSAIPCVIDNMNDLSLEDEEDDFDHLQLM
jgi:hypothetical protein